MIILKFLYILILKILSVIKRNYRRLKYFILPNIFTKATYSYRSFPDFQQKTIISGKGILRIGERCGFGYKIGGFWRNGSIEIQPRRKGATIKIGNSVHTNNNIFICALKYISIGDNTRIGQNVCIMDFEAHNTNPLERSKVGEIGIIEIAENVWIGNNVTILKNSKIGKNSIVATGAVVNGSFPDNVIIGGIPAKIIKTL